MKIFRWMSGRSKMSGRTVSLILMIALLAWGGCGKKKRLRSKRWQRKL